ncbi:MAG: FixH family protein [Pseudomonadota bacterium]
MAEINGRHVLAGFGLAFGTIIAVNMTLAVSAVRTFPGLEVKNSYVASQKFDAARAAQLELGWDVSAWVEDGHLYLNILQDGVPVAPEILSATFGRATNVTQDQIPEFEQVNGAFVATVVVGDGNWNLRLKARAENGTLFEQRIIVGTL